MAAGVGFTMIGGMAVAAAAPAYAAPGTPDPFGYTVSEVYASDIAPDESVYTGWHQGHPGAVNAHEVTADGLVLTGKSQVIYGYDESVRPSIEYRLFMNSVDRGEVSWTSTSDSDPAYFQIPVFFGQDVAAPNFTTLRPAAPTSGQNIASLDQQWVTSRAIGSAYAADATDALGELLSALIAEQNAEILGFGVFADEGQQSTVTGIGWLGTDYTFHPGERMIPGTVSIAGQAKVGSTLTAEVADWPAGATFTYQWYRAQENMGGPIDGETGATYTVTADDIGFFIGVDITGHKAGYGDAQARADVTAKVTAPVKPAAPAPVANSTDLAAFLSSNGATVQQPSAAGLPSSPLSPSQAYTATLPWTEADSWVDVYIYSTPVFVGTFPIVNGQAQIVLSASVLSALDAGTHTLVVTGQSSGAVQAVSVSLARMLAATGAAPALPLAASAALLLLGTALVVLRRARLKAA
ncbi:hypothetical protein [Ruicaihuangia caeni]|uniref:hypothetical protein n=1 Tax=Ruicaihuangia caeni TaxID=3042517 RepID=UPI0033902D90